jgi:molybdenum cofactor cytidylyltransferase
MILICASTKNAHGLMQSSQFHPAVVILAAGKSSRMGRHKLLLPWGETTVLGHLIDCWSRLPVDQVAVVCAPVDTDVQAEMDRLRFPREQRIINPDPSRGMFSSIQCTAQWPGWKESVTHWAVALGDQPHVRFETLRAVADFAARHPTNICQAARHGHGRHPVFFPKAAFAAIAETNAETLKHFLESRAAEVKLIESDDAGLDLDLDHPTDYKRALKIFRDNVS